MKHLQIIYSFLFLLLLNCSSDEDQFNQPLNGQTFRLTSILIDVPIDLNNDGVFSNDIMLEESQVCFQDNIIRFAPNVASQVVQYVTFFSLNPDNSTYDGQGCAVIDSFAHFNYMVEDDLVYVFLRDEPFDETTATIGELSDDSITFHLDWFMREIGLNVVIDENGQEFIYEADASLVFTLQNN